MQTLKHIRTHARGALAASVVLISTLAAPMTSVSARGPVDDTAVKAVDWLITKQEANGGFGTGFSKGSDVGATADAILAFASIGKNAAEVKNSAGRSPIDFLALTLRLRRAINPGQYAKMALAVKAAGLDPRNFNRSDLLASVLSGYNPKTSVLGDSVYVHCLSMVALARGGASVPADAIAKLESLQAASGGWAFLGDDKADVDTTALCIQALVAVGQDTKLGKLGKAIGYLRSLQNADGGFPYQVPSQYGTESNANSTALVAQTIIAVGQQPESWAAAKGNPLSFLIGLQQPSGAIAYQGSMPDENVLASAQAIPALNRKAYGQ